MYELEQNDPALVAAVRVRLDGFLSALAAEMGVKSTLRPLTFGRRLRERERSELAQAIATLLDEERRRLAGVFEAHYAAAVIELERLRLVTQRVEAERRRLGLK